MMMTVTHALETAGVGGLRSGIEVRVRGTVGLRTSRGLVQLSLLEVDPAFTAGRLALDRGEVLRRLAAEGCAILYISHKLEEIRVLCEAATIMRQGRVVARCDPRAETAHHLAELMIGSELIGPVNEIMAELEKMTRVARREVPGAPHEVLLVMDATTGQNGLTQAKEFTKSAGVTGLVLTKLDGTAKGGVVTAIARELKIPIRFVGVGEKIDDLVEFSADDFVESLFAA